MPMVCYQRIPGSRSRRPRPLPGRRPMFEETAMPDSAADTAWKRKRYFEQSRKVAEKWTTFFDNAEFLNAAYWTLFTELFIREADGQQTNYGDLTELVVERAGCSTPTAHRMIRRAKDAGLLVTRRPKGQGNVTLYYLAPHTRAHCEAFADFAIQSYAAFEDELRSALSD